MKSTNALIFGSAWQLAGHSRQTWRRSGTCGSSTLTRRPAAMAPAATQSGISAMPAPASASESNGVMAFAIGDCGKSMSTAAPGALTLQSSSAGGTKTRPVCVYPLKVAYVAGDVNVAASYTCS